MILAANRCHDRSPNFYVADSLSEVAGILSPRLGDVAMVIVEGAFQAYRLVESDEAADDFNVIPSNSCEYVWVRSGNVLDVTLLGANGNGSQSEAEANTVAFRRAAEFAAGGVLYVPAGTFYVLGNIGFESNTIITGTGTVKLVDNSTASALFAVQGKTNVTIDGLTLDGNIAGQSVWSEHLHSFRVDNSSYVRIRNVTFRNIVGDGVYMGRLGTDTPPYVGVSDSIIESCFFIGNSTLSLQNRNGVSVTCGQRIDITDCFFYRMARSTMPGCVDFEPDDANDFIYDCSVSSCRFTGHALAALTNQTGVSINNTNNGTVQGITIGSTNIFDGNFQYCIYLIGGSSGNDSALVTGNIIRNHQYTAPDVARAISTKGFNVSITSNIIDTFMGVGMWLETGTIECVSNFVRRAQKQGIVVGPAALVARNTIIDAGYNGANSQRCGIYMESTGATISGNQIISSGPTVTLYGILSSVGSGNAISENFLTGIGTANFSSVGSQIWGINYTATSPGPDILAANDRKILLWRGADPFADNMQIQFGGTTASYAAILAIGQTLRAVLADGSGYAKFYANSLYLNSVPAYANNAAALGGGLVAGDIYVVSGSDPRQIARVF